MLQVHGMILQELFVSRGVHTRTEAPPGNEQNKFTSNQALERAQVELNLRYK